MSPAKKRKKAQRAASRSKAPMKAPSAAGRKPAAGKAAARKPAVSKPMARKLASRTSAARTAERCTLPPRRLAGLLDGAERSELLAHVPACGACSTTLTVLAAESQGLQRLALESAGGTAVERILARGVRLGDRRLADLVYEMAKACLVVVQDIDRRLHLATRPRDAAVIEREVRGVSARLPARLREAASAMPHGKPEEGQALNAAESCVRILERVEGASERQRLAKSVWLICAGRASEAEGVLREGIADPSGLLRNVHVVRNLQWALIRQDKFDQCVQIGEDAIRVFPEDWQVAYNFAAACAWLGDTKKFKLAARRLRGIKPPSEGVARLRDRILKFELPRFGDVLSMTNSDIAKNLGVAAAGAGG